MNNVIRTAQTRLLAARDALDKASGEYHAAKSEYEYAIRDIAELLLRAGSAVIAISELAEPAAEAVA